VTIRSPWLPLFFALLLPAGLRGEDVPKEGVVEVEKAEKGEKRLDTSTPEAAVNAFLVLLREGKLGVEENPVLVLSRFCPEEKAERYAEGVSAFAGELEGAEARVEGKPVQRGDFAGCLLRIRRQGNPLDVSVRPLCLLRSDKGWRVAVGLSHFQNTGFGFQSKRHKTAREIASEIRHTGSDLEAKLLSEGMQTLREALAASRAKQGKLTREGLIRHFLKRDSEGDAMGKLACLKIPEDFPPRRLGRLFTLIAAPQYMAGTEPKAVSAAGSEGESRMVEDRELADPLFVFLDAKKKGEQFCHVLGLVHPHDPTDYHTAPFYLTKEGERWVIIPHQIELDGLPLADSRLRNWYDENEWEWTSLLVKKVGEQAGERGETSARRAHASFLRAVREGDVQAALRLLELPPEDADIGGEEVFDGLGEFWNFMRGGAETRKGLADTLIKTVETVEEGRVSVSLHAVFRPQSAGRNMLALKRTQVVQSDERWFIRLWTDAALPVEKDGVDAILRRLRQKTRSTDPQKRQAAALAFIDAPWVPAGAGDEAEERDVDALEEAANKLLDDVRAKRTRAVLARAILPPGEDVQRGERALGEVADLIRDVRDAAGDCDPQAVSVADSWGGVILPMVQPEREDGRIPARLLVFVRRGGGWYWVPGMQFFREINRGYKALNSSALRHLKEDISPGDWKAIDHLREVLKATEKEAEEEKNDA